MKLRKFYAIALAGLLLGFFSCEESNSDPNTLGGNQSPIGDVGTTFFVSGLPAGISNTSAEITNLENGVSTVTVSANITNQKILGLLSSIDGYEEGMTEITGKFRITDEGVESIYDDGSCVMVQFDAEVGDVYTSEHGSMTIKREVVSRSTDDDYYWGGMIIKTITVKETGRNIPGLKDVEIDYNHRFGAVGYKITFEDGSYEAFNIYGSTNNDH